MGPVCRPLRLLVLFYLVFLHGSQESSPIGATAAVTRTVFSITCLSDGGHRSHRKVPFRGLRADIDFRRSAGEDVKPKSWSNSWLRLRGGGNGGILADGLGFGGTASEDIDKTDKEEDGDEDHTFESEGVWESEEDMNEFSGTEDIDEGVDEYTDRCKDDGERGTGEGTEEDAGSGVFGATGRKTGERRDDGSNSLESGAILSPMGVQAQFGLALPHLVKHLGVLIAGNWVAKKLDPAIPGRVRVGRIIYAAYLVLYHVVCMYIRVRIWKASDDTEVEIPPPPQLQKMMDGVGEANEGGEGGSAGESSGASALAPVMAKMLSGKTTASQYDMKLVQSMRRVQSIASAFMCLTHFKKGMIKPMILQVAFGLLGLFDSPVFKVHVLGKKAEGNLARPFKPHGLSEVLKGPLESMAAQAEAAAKVKTETEAEQANNDGSSGEEESGRGVDTNGAGGGLPTGAGGGLSGGKKEELGNGDVGVDMFPDVEDKLSSDEDES